ncbi:hypothetical protein [Candidatus Enterovibrio escicola]|nr:hypothetical protein [Candidatus Enterovibrio escacola]
MNNLDAVLLKSTISAKLSSLYGKTLHFFRYQIKKQTFSPLS